MSLSVNHQQQSKKDYAFKHYCKICKKAFVDGRALCGHMQDYGISPNPENGDHEDPTCDDGDDKFGGGGGGGSSNGNNDLPPVNKRMYALRTNPNRLKRCCDCSIGGKDSSSGKSLLGHGDSSYDDVDDPSLMSSPRSSEDEDEDIEAQEMLGWSKRKRSFKETIENDNTNRPSNEEQDLINCLMLLSKSVVEGAKATELEESYTSASKEDERGINKPLNFAANNTITTVAASYKASSITDNKGKSVVTPPKGMFECKACKKVFSSHQALGGHRASHKKVKGCFAAKLDQETTEDSNLADDQDTTTNEELYFLSKNNSVRFDYDHNNQQGSNSKKKSKVHQCSICNRIFSSGQALGGHKRCHWITSSLVANTSATSLVTANYHHLRNQIEQQIQQNSSKFMNNSEPIDLALDLNLSAPVNQQSSSFTDISSKIHFQSWVNKEQLENNVYHQSHIQHNNNRSTQSMKDEDDNKVKLPKLCELKDMNINGGSSSPWLQVGLGSTNDQVRADSTDFCKEKRLDICP